MKEFSGRGGGKKCAEAFGVSPQQWSPWERGKRTPDEVRLGEIAGFFGVSVEWMRCDHRPPPLGRPRETPPPGVDQTSQSAANMHSPFSGIAGVDVPPPPSWEPAPPGSAASFFWLVRHFIIEMQTQGLHIHLDKQSLEHLAYLIKSTRV